MLGLCGEGGIQACGGNNMLRILRRFMAFLRKRADRDEGHQGLLQGSQSSVSPLALHWRSLLLRGGPLLGPPRHRGAHGPGEAGAPPWCARVRGVRVAQSPPSTLDLT